MFSIRLSQQGSFARTKARFRLAIVLLFASLSIPICFLLIRAYQQLQNESYLQLRSTAETVHLQISQQLFELLKPEEARTFDEYSFFSVTQNPLVQEKGVRFSPLAEYPPKTSFPGVRGYFQINPDGSFHSPILPDIDLGQGGDTQYGMSSAEVQKRIVARAELVRILGENRVLATWVGTQESISSPRDLRKNETHASTPQNSAGLPKQKLSDLKLDSGAWSRNMVLEEQSQSGDYAGASNSPLNQERLKRKEQVQIPLQQRLGKKGGLFDTAQVENDRADDAPLRRELKQTADKTPKDFILTFEGEIDPMQILVLPSNNIVFYRKVWRDKARYIQGFVVNQAAFLAELIENNFYQSTLGGFGTLTIGYRGEVLKQLTPQENTYRYRSSLYASLYSTEDASTNGAESLVLRRSLPSPFDNFELVFSAPHIPLGGGRFVVHALAGSIFLVLTSGLFIIYRLGIMQISLAEKKSDFVSAVSHELKTPLTSIRMYAEMLRAGWVKDKEKERSYFDFIFFESERLSRLIANVLQLAGLAKGTTALQLKEHSATELLSLCESKVKSMVEAKQFTLECEKPIDENAQISVDSDAFVQIIINLVDNALKFSARAEHKVLKIGFRVSSSTPSVITFFVRDFGPGVEPSQRKKIFELFYRSESELVRTTPGTGIGLALVKGLALQMAAEVDLINQNPGVEFQVRFKAR